MIDQSINTAGRGLAGKSVWGGAFLTTISTQSDLQLQLCSPALAALFSSRSLLLGLLHDEGLVDVGDDTTAGNGGLDQRVELLVASDSEQQVSWCDSLDLEVLGGVTCEFEDFRGQVLENGGGVNC